jgi:hypothetical protein
MGPADIRELHKTLGKESSQLFCMKAHVSHYSREEWEKTPPNQTCDFELVADRPADRETAFRGSAKHRVSVLLLYPPEQYGTSSYWVSWYEKWRKDRHQGFVLLTASWTVYRGIRAQPDKAQLVRAEWDQIKNDVGSKDAGQPHWHFDQPVAMAIMAPSCPVTSTLREVQPLNVGLPTSIQTIGQEQKVDHVHLAMGAWHATRPHPECWQRDVRAWPDLHEWAIRTLEYLQAQFAKKK